MKCVCRNVCLCVCVYILVIKDGVYAVIVCDMIIFTYFSYSISTRSKTETYWCVCVCVLWNIFVRIHSQVHPITPINNSLFVFFFFLAVAAIQFDFNSLNFPKLTACTSISYRKSGTILCHRTHYNLIEKFTFVTTQIIILSLLFLRSLSISRSKYSKYHSITWSVSVTIYVSLSFGWKQLI